MQEVEGLAGDSSSAAAGSSTLVPSANPSATPSLTPYQNPSPVNSFIKRQRAATRSSGSPSSSSAGPMELVDKLLGARNEIPGYEFSGSDSEAEFSNGDGQDAGFSSDSSKNTINSDPFSDPDFFEKRQSPGELPGPESSASHSESDFENGDGQFAGSSSDSFTETAPPFLVE